MSSTRSGARPRLARRLSWLAILSLTSAALFAPSATPVLAASVTPIAISSGNPTCATFDGTYGGGQSWQEVKSDPPGDGSINVPGFGTITVSNFDQSASGAAGSFDWSSTFGVDAVFVNTYYFWAKDAQPGGDGKGTVCEHKVPAHGKKLK